MTYEHWWDQRYGDHYAIRIENGKVTGWYKVPQGETVTVESLPRLVYDTDAGNITYCEEIRSHAKVLLFTEAV